MIEDALGLVFQISLCFWVGVLWSCGCGWSSDVGCLVTVPC